MFSPTLHENTTWSDARFRMTIRRKVGGVFSSLVENPNKTIFFNQNLTKKNQELILKVEL